MDSEPWMMLLAAVVLQWMRDARRDAYERWLLAQFLECDQETCMALCERSVIALVWPRPRR